MNTKRYVVIVPTYNEAHNIKQLIDSVLHLSLDFDLLIIDDHSPDNTAILVKQLQSLDPVYKKHVHLLQRPHKMGLGSAYVKGFQWALSRPYTHICQMDADLSHDPKDLEKLIQATNDADLVLGTRYMIGGGSQGWSLHRKLLSRTANCFARFVTGLPFQDLTGGFKCFTKKALSLVAQSPIRSEGYAFQIETTCIVAKRMLRIREVPIIFKERTKGKSKFSKKIIWEGFWTVLRLGWDLRTFQK